MQCGPSKDDRGYDEALRRAIESASRMWRSRWEERAPAALVSATRGISGTIKQWIHWVRSADVGVGGGKHGKGHHQYICVPVNEDGTVTVPDDGVEDREDVKKSYRNELAHALASITALDAEAWIAGVNTGSPLVAPWTIDFRSHEELFTECGEVLPYLTHWAMQIPKLVRHSTDLHKHAQFPSWHHWAANIAAHIWNACHSIYFERFGGPRSAGSFSDDPEESSDPSELDHFGKRLLNTHESVIVPRIGFWFGEVEADELCARLDTEAQRAWLVWQKLPTYPKRPKTLSKDEVDKATNPLDADVELVTIRELADALRSAYGTRGFGPNTVRDWITKAGIEVVNEDKNSHAQYYRYSDVRTVIEEKKKKTLPRTFEELKKKRLNQ